MTLEELVSKLEKAEAGSRELDAEIGAAVRFSGDFDVSKLRFPDKAEFVAIEDGSVRIYGLDSDGNMYAVARRSAPHYTTSIDAALSLVPEGLRWAVWGDGEASVCRERPDGLRRFWDTSQPAATPALALCIAALKARKG